MRKSHQWLLQKIDAVIFIIDPLTAHPHDTDINTLMRVCNVHNVPIAINIATAIHLLSSKRFKYFIC